MVKGGNVLHHLKREGELSGRRRICPGEYVHREMSGSHFDGPCDVNYLKKLSKIIITSSVAAEFGRHGMPLPDSNADL